MMFGSDGGAGPAEHPGGAASASENRTPVPFSGGRKPIPRSVRIVSMQDSNTATGAGTGGAGGRREPGTDRTTTTRVSSSAGATHPPFPSSSFFRSGVWPSAVKASAIGGLSPTFFFFFPDTGCPLACRGSELVRTPNPTHVSLTCKSYHTSSLVLGVTMNAHMIL
jgi:hypothetical protein